MNGNVFIPQKLKIGFQERSDTYTKKLAYVIYFDEKGTLRKEASWQSWRDKKIDPIEIDNVPTSGFVLNKKVGGYKSDWNFRNAYVRVYDPRDFEFEITIPNLLFILENTSAIKGKDLDIKVCNISGYTVQDWITDIKSRIDVLAQKIEEDNLKALEKKLETLLSDDKRTSLELDSIEALLKG